jgi:hypothetical protein
LDFIGTYRNQAEKVRTYAVLAFDACRVKLGQSFLTAKGQRCDDLITPAWSLANIP